MREEKLLTSLGAAIRKRRMALKVSQEAFADLIGMHRAYYSAIERGERNLTLGTLHRVAKGLGVRMADLMRDCNIYRPSRADRLPTRFADLALRAATRASLTATLFQFRTQRSCFDSAKHCSTCLLQKRGQDQSKHNDRDPKEMCMTQMHRMVERRSQ